MRKEHERVGEKISDPRGYTSTYTRDAMDRVTGITYDDGTPNATFAYNAVGNLTQSSNANVTNNYTAFDQDGRVTASNLQVQGNTYTFGYQYDLAGDLTQETYPSGRKVTTAFDVAQRPPSTSANSGTEPQILNGQEMCTDRNRINVNARYPAQS